MENLSKKELLNLFEKLSEDTLKKLGIYNDAKEIYEEKEKLEKLKKERIEKAKILVKEAQELLNIYRLKLIVNSRGIWIKDQYGRFLDKKDKRKRISRGLKTSHNHYRIPILRALTDLGGQGNVGEILKIVYSEMKSRLNSVDLEMIPSGTDFRWRNTAMWVRNLMVNEGLLKKGTPRGIWEITDKGRSYLKEHSNGKT